MVNTTLKAVTTSSDPEDVVRRQIANTLRIGLPGYVDRGGLPAHLSVQVDVDEDEARPRATADDPWNNWVFSIRGAASFQGEESNRDTQLSGSFSADRITPDWKLTVAAAIDSVEGRLEAFQYLHDLEKSRLEADGEISWRIARGFSVSAEATASRIRDQLALPRRGATPEEILLRLRQLRSGYEYDSRLSLTYTFGSIFSAIVNPRFGQ